MFQKITEHKISILDTEDWSNDYWKYSFAITSINYISKHNTKLF